MEIKGTFANFNQICTFYRLRRHSWPVARIGRPFEKSGSGKSEQIDAVEVQVAQHKDKCEECEWSL